MSNRKHLNRGSAGKNMGRDASFLVLRDGDLHLAQHDLPVPWLPSVHRTVPHSSVPCENMAYNHDCPGSSTLCGKVSSCCWHIYVPRLRALQPNQVTNRAGLKDVTCPPQHPTPPTYFLNEKRRVFFRRQMSFGNELREPCVSPRNKTKHFSRLIVGLGHSRGAPLLRSSRLLD